jgi:ArsR family metal-binding transcriptional regulator
VPLLVSRLVIVSKAAIVTRASVSRSSRLCTAAATWDALQDRLVLIATIRLACVLVASVRLRVIVRTRDNPVCAVVVRTRTLGPTVARSLVVFRDRPVKIAMAKLGRVEAVHARRLVTVTRAKIVEMALVSGSRLQSTVVRRLVAGLDRLVSRQMARRVLVQSNAVRSATVNKGSAVCRARVSEVRRDIVATKRVVQRAAHVRRSRANRVFVEGRHHRQLAKPVVIATRGKTARVENA